MFNELGRNADNFLSLGYLSGYDASLDPYFIDLVDKRRKIMWTLSLISLLIFLLHLLC